MISVCLASYNGERFILEQINSILTQLEPEDELLVSDDGSSDNTMEVINSLKDSRIKVFKNKFSNPIQNFEFLINIAKNEYIFLSDQDDIWHPNKVKIFLNYLNQHEKGSLIISDIKLIDETNKELGISFYPNGFKSGILVNLFKNNYVGCTMAFNNAIKRVILPFPQGIGMHDWWIGLCCKLFYEVKYIDQPLQNYRRHDNNFTKPKKKNYLKLIYWRWVLIKSLIIRYFTIKLRN